MSPKVLGAVPECLTCSHHRTGTKDGVQPDIPEPLQEPSEVVLQAPPCVLEVQLEASMFQVRRTESAIFRSIQAIFMNIAE